MVERLVAEVDPSIGVSVDVPRSEALSSVAQATRLLLYTLSPTGKMGMPMSVVEAMLCGTIPVLPDRDESRAIVGDHARTYRDRTELVADVRAIAVGGPDIEAERRELVQRAQCYREPAVLAGLHSTLQEQLTRWRAQRL